MGAESLVAEWASERRVWLGELSDKANTAAEKASTAVRLTPSLWDQNDQAPSARLHSSLMCPCGADLVWGTASRELHGTCARCGAPAKRANGQYVFETISPGKIQQDWLNRMKEVAKRRLGRFYGHAIQLLSPYYGPPHVQRFLSTFDLRRDFVADLGSGPLVHSDRVLCVDGNNYANVHVVANLERLPMKCNTFSGLISVAVLEHVSNPEAHVAEMWRVLKPGGRVLCLLPFMQGFHASPMDYRRYTLHGMRELFKDFQLLDLRVASGPTSGMLWVLQEWLAIALSLGSRRLYRLLLPLTWSLSPLKYLDVLLSRHPAAAAVASAFVIEAKKPDPV